MTRILDGTSGYAYKEWKGGFYPSTLRQARWLGHYSGRLPTVEINSTFYRLPKRETLAAWAAQVPEGFRFALKASRRITHLARLGEGATDAIEYFVGVVSVLGGRLGPLLFQLPPDLPADLGLLRDFLARLPRSRRVALEFRHRSWFDDAVLAALSEANVALCLTDGPTPSPQLATTSWGYLRLRRGGYEEAELERWRALIEELGWREAFVFFKHEEHTDPERASAAPRHAERLCG